VKQHGLCQVMVLVSVLCLGHQVRAQESPLASWESGSGSPVVVVLHGGPGAEHSYLLPEWRRLEEFSTVVFYDQRGCGGSADLPGPYTWSQHVEDLDLLIRDHARGRPVVLAGSSWGAILALLYGLEGKEPIEGIILSGYPGWWGPESTAGGSDLFRVSPREEGVDPGPLSRRLSQPDTLSSGQSIGGYAADSVVGSRIVDSGNSAVNGDILSGARTMPSEDALAVLKTPILIFSGDRGGNVPDGGVNLVRIAPNATRVVIRDAAHDPWAADPDAFFGAVEDFLGALGLTDTSETGAAGSGRRRPDSPRSRPPFLISSQVDSLHAAAEGDSHARNREVDVLELRLASPPDARCVGSGSTHVRGRDLGEGDRSRDRQSVDRDHRVCRRP